MAVWWRPGEREWWIGAGFALGSTCFAVAAIASQWASVSRPAIGVTFFAGSVFFTGAAYLQFWEVVHVEGGPIHRRERHKLRPATWTQPRIDWITALIQLVGTLFFNLSCFAAMHKGLDARQADLRVWSPDVFGSVCFLVASEGALAETCGRWICVRPGSLTWRIAALNLAGSVAFGVAAGAALVQPSTNEPVSAAVDNAGTAIGALCFLAGALVLIPESAQRRRSSPVPSDAPA